MAERKIVQGTVRDFDPARGHGEVETEDGRVYAVHRNDLRDEALQGVYPGDIVEFVIGRNRFGRPAAQEVRRVGWEEGGDDGPGEWTF